MLPCGTCADCPTATAFALSPRAPRWRTTRVPRGCKPMRGQPGLWRIRVRDYRVLYEIADKVLLVVVAKVGHRREVYRRR
jgi:mRNA-degrading endonuclease RelE of RelBE toxin-antitoxin system